ncbi:MAG: hypothetical protein HY343_07675 [Lentisphaerae bacterium]|nr:hypothetical protein [Lentisphaerota bacterium]
MKDFRFWILDFGLLMIHTNCRLRLLLVVALLAGLCEARAGSGPVISESRPSSDDYRMTPERAFLWEEAQSVMASARAPEEFLRAARLYQRLVDEGLRGGILFYNQGTALLQGGRPADAVEVFLRAERYGGRDEALRRNLRLAMARSRKVENLELPWYRIPLLWHFSLPGETRARIAAVAFSVFWIILALRALGIRRLTRYLLIVSGAACIFFGSSVATSLHQEAGARRPEFALPAPEKRLPANGANSRE